MLTDQNVTDYIIRAEKETSSQIQFVKTLQITDCDDLNMTA